MTVHDVQVDPICSRAVESFNFAIQTGVIGSQERGRHYELPFGLLMGGIHTPMEPTRAPFYEDLLGRSGGWSLKSGVKSRALGGSIGSGICRAWSGRHRVVVGGRWREFAGFDDFFDLTAIERFVLQQ